MIIVLNRLCFPYVLEIATKQFTGDMMWHLGFAFKILWEKGATIKAECERIRGNDRTSLYLNCDANHKSIQLTPKGKRTQFCCILILKIKFKNSYYGQKEWRNRWNKAGHDLLIFGAEWCQKWGNSLSSLSTEDLYI